MSYSREIQFTEFSVKNKILIMKRPSEIQIKFSEVDNKIISTNSRCCIPNKSGEYYNPL
jgi:hypothetical protein